MEKMTMNHPCIEEWRRRRRQAARRLALALRQEHARHRGLVGRRARHVHQALPRVGPAAQDVWRPVQGNARGGRQEGRRQEDGRGRGQGGEQGEHGSAYSRVHGEENFDVHDERRDLNAETSELAAERILHVDVMSM